MKLLILLFCLLLGSCSTPVHTIQYSNLSNNNSIKEVREILAQKEISTAHIDTYFNFVKDINERAASRLQGDFTAMLSDKVSYTKFAYQPSDYGEVSAKAAAFILLQDHIKSKNIESLASPLLEEDINFLTNALSLKPSLITAYQAIFQPIALNKATTLGEHIACIQEKMQEDTVTFETSLQIYLIRLYVHNSTIHTRYVEHAGVLIEKNNDLVFLEKIGSGYPFQATKFDNRTQLIHYLLQRDIPQVKLL